MKYIGTGGLLARKMMMFSLTASFTTGQNAMKRIRRDRQEDIVCHYRASEHHLNSGESQHEKRYPVFWSPVTLILFPEEYSALQVILDVLNIMVFQNVFV